MATKRPEEIGTNELLRIALQVADGCAYLAQRKVVHRSLKAEVVLINNHNDVRIGGLGSIKDISLHEEYVTVNNDYVALANAQNKPRSDIRWLASFTQAFLVSFMCARTSLIRMLVSLQAPRAGTSATLLRRLSLLARRHYQTCRASHQIVGPWLLPLRPRSSGTRAVPERPGVQHHHGRLCVWNGAVGDYDFRTLAVWPAQHPRDQRPNQSVRNISEQAARLLARRFRDYASMLAKGRAFAPVVCACPWRYQDGHTRRVQRPV